MSLEFSRDKKVCPKTALILEDDEGLRNALAEIVGSYGLTCTHAANVRQAAERYCKADFDVVVMNLYMIEIKGLEWLDMKGIVPDEMIEEHFSICSPRGLELIRFIRDMNPDQAIIALSSNGPKLFDDLHHSYPHQLHTLEIPCPSEAFGESLHELIGISPLPVTDRQVNPGNTDG